MMRRLITVVIAVLLCVTNSYAQKKYAMLVGISNYHALNKANEWNNIHGTNDVSLITPMLKRQGFKVSVITDYWCPVNGYNALFLLILMVDKPLSA